MNKSISAQICGVTKVIDNEKPEEIIVEFKDDKNEIWGELSASEKEFKTGSKGFYAFGKLENPHSGELYQVSCNIVLIGSKNE